MSRRRKLPFELRPLDDAVRDGSSCMVSDGQQFAVARWDGEGWVFPAAGGMQLDFVPVGYHR